MAKNTNGPALPIIRRSLMDYCKVAAKRIKGFNFEERQRFLRLLVDSVVLEDQRIRIKGVIRIQEKPEPMQWPVHSEAKKTSQEVNDRIADMALYSCAPNTVDEIPFEFAKSLPPILIPLHEILTSSLLKRVVGLQPNATLKQLCQQVQFERGITLSSTSMCRALKRFGLTRKERHHLSAQANG